MKLLTNCILAAGAVVAIGMASYAQESSTADKPCCSKEAADKSACDKSACDKSACDKLAKCSCESKEACTCKKSDDACAVTTAMAKLPKMSYRVAGEDTCCSKSAEKLAATHDAAILFVVVGQTFETKQAAYTSLVEQTESMLDSFVTPCKCEVSGVTSIAGTKCNCPTKAGKTAEVVQNAIKGLQMTYAVGEKACDCPMKAKKMAKAAGTETAYVVAGEKTNCPLTARLNLARAKYRAAVTALAAQDQPAAVKAESGT